VTAPDLATAARLIANLRPDWERPERFHEAKSEALALLRRAGAAPCAGCEADTLRERLARAHALLRHAAAEVARHRRLLASAVRPPRRRRAGPDARQGRLPLPAPSEPPRRRGATGHTEAAAAAMASPSARVGRGGR
jgi:hypothetical protein